MKVQIIIHYDGDGSWPVAVVPDGEGEAVAERCNAEAGYNERRQAHGPCYYAGEPVEVGAVPDVRNEGNED